MKISTIMLLVSLGLLIPAGMLWRMAGLVTRDIQRFMGQARPASGIVVSLQWRASRSGYESRLHCYPEIAFSLPDGQRIQTTTRTGNLQRPAKEGATVQILYNPSNPQEIDLASQAPRTLMKAGYRALALAFTMFSLGGLGLWWLLFRWWGIPA